MSDDSWCDFCGEKFCGPFGFGTKGMTLSDMKPSDCIMYCSRKCSLKDFRLNELEKYHTKKLELLEKQNELIKENSVVAAMALRLKVDSHKHTGKIPAQYTWSL